MVAFRTRTNHQVVSPGLNRTMALRQAYSVESISTRRNRLTMFCNRRISDMPATILSVGTLSTCSPAAFRSGPMSNGNENCAMLSTKSSLQPSSSKMAWSRKGRSRNVGMFRAQVTDIYSSCTADSYKFSGEGWNITGGVPTAVGRWPKANPELTTLDEGIAPLVRFFASSLLSMRLVIDIKLCFLEGKSGDWLLFCPWYLGGLAEWYWEAASGGEKCIWPEGSEFCDISCSFAISRIFCFSLPVRICSWSTGHWGSKLTFTGAVGGFLERTCGVRGALSCWTARMNFKEKLARARLTQTLVGKSKGRVLKRRLF